MSPKLSICIPTYNRVGHLKACLETLVPQVTALPIGVAEIVIVNNASTDSTEQLLNTLPSQYPFIRVFSNPTNLGIDGNTAKCIEHAEGEYTALLSDDDFYLEGQVAQILDVVSKQEYGLLRLNFHTFLDDMHMPYQTFAPEKDIVFPYAADMLSFFHGGHFSGVVFRSELAKQALSKMLALRPLSNTGRSRGIYGEIEIRIVTTCDLPAYFVGKRRLATTIPKSLDYAGLEHICLEYVMVCERMYQDGVIPLEEYERRKRETVGRLPQMIVTFAPAMNNADLIRVTEGLDHYLHGDARFRLIALPMLRLARWSVVKAAFVLVHRTARLVKRTVIRKSGGLIHH